MAFKRGANLMALDLSGPHAATVYNEVEHIIIERLNAFNAWVEMSNAMNPKPEFQQQRCTWICFTRFQRQFVLRWHVGENRWELDGVIDKEQGDGGGGPPPDGPVDGGGGFDLVLSGGFFLPPPTRQPRRARPARGQRGRPPADRAGAKRPVEKPREEAPPATRVAHRIVLRTRALLRTVQRTPLFRHTLSQFEASVAEMKAVGLLLRGTAHALALKAAGWLMLKLADVRSFFIEDFEAEPGPRVYAEPRRIEIRQGFTLVLYNFESERPDWESWLFGKLEIEIEYPNWESWLFGEPLEDEQKVA